MSASVCLVLWACDAGASEQSAAGSRGGLRMSGQGAWRRTETLPPQVGAVWRLDSRRATAAMEIRLLGLMEASHDGHPLLLGGAKPRGLLAMLALHANTAVSVDRLIEGLWGERPPATAPKIVQVLVSQLRKQLAGADAEIVTRGRGYELRLDSDAVDALHFERLLTYGANGSRLHEALALWRGPPPGARPDGRAVAGRARVGARPAARRSRRRAVRRARDSAARGTLAGRARGCDRRRVGRGTPRGGSRRARRPRARPPVARAAPRPAHARAVPLRPAG